MAAHRRALHGHGRLARLEQAELPDDLGEFLVKAVPPRSVAPVVCVNTFVTAFLPDVAHRAVFRTMSEFAKGFTVRNKLPFMWVRFEPPRAGDADPPHPGFCRWQVEVWDERAQHRRVVLGWAHPHLVRMELGEGLVELRSLRRQDA
jgi:hypothetical protein